jgi:hypothetical protein
MDHANLEPIYLFAQSQHSTFETEVVELNISRAPRHPTRLTISKKVKLIFCNVSLSLCSVLIICASVSTIFFGTNVLTIPCSINPHFAGSAPLCGVPKNITPYVLTNIERRSSADFPPSCSDISRARFTRMPPRECATKIMGFEDCSSDLRSRARLERRVCACWWIISELLSARG